MAKRVRKPLDLSFTDSDLSSSHKEVRFSWIKNCFANIERYCDLDIGEAVVPYKNGKPDSNRDGTYEKYIVVKKDDLGLVYCKRLLSGNKLSKTMTCITAETYNNDSGWGADPTQIEMLLLNQDGEYDPTAELRKAESRKNKCRRINIKKKFQNVKDEEGLKKLILSFKPGDVFYDSDTLGSYSTKCAVIKVEERMVAKNGYYSGYDKVKRTVLTVNRSGKYGGSTEYTEYNTYTFKNMFKEKTIPLEDI